MTAAYRDLRWMDRAACKGSDLRAFYPESGADSAAVIKAAKRICAPCPVRNDCAEYALARPKEAGLWGGMTEDERKQERRRRSRVAADRRASASAGEAVA